MTKRILLGCLLLPAAIAIQAGLEGIGIKSIPLRILICSVITLPAFIVITDTE